MKIPELTEGRRRWDTYNAFHWHVAANFVAFDTGEVICTARQPNPDFRHVYDKLNVTLVASSDTDCPLLMTPDKRDVAKAWLDNNGMQYLLIDHDTDYVVALDSPIGPERDTRPKRFRPKHPPKGGEGAYFAGEGIAPLGGCVTVNTNKWLSQEDKERLDDLVCSARAALTLEGEKYSRHCLPVPSSRLLACADWTELNGTERGAVLLNRIAPAKHIFDHLLLRK